MNKNEAFENLILGMWIGSTILMTMLVILLIYQNQDLKISNQILTDKINEMCRGK